MVAVLDLWDVSHMSNTDETPLQFFVRKAIEQAPRARDYYDSVIQKRAGTKGKPLYDLSRGKGLRPSVAMLDHMATALGQPIGLLTRAAQGEDVLPLPVPEHPQPDQMPTVGVADGDGAITLKRINLGFAMGDGSNLDDYVEEGTVEFDPNLLRAISQSPPHRLLVAHGAGDSMQPTLLDSDMIVIDTLQTRLNMTDRIWAIALYGAGAVKRLRPAAGGKVEIISDNTLHDKQVVDGQDVRIIGRVVWSGRRH
jgi:hypothetical protein